MLNKLIGAAVAAFIFTGGANAAVEFKFYGNPTPGTCNGGNGFNYCDSVDYSEGGIDLTVTASSTYTRRSADVYRGHGLGVGYRGDDSPTQVDGYYDEYLQFSFDPTVILSSMTFWYVDRNDDFDLWAYQDGSWNQLYNEQDPGNNAFSVFNFNTPITASAFRVGADGNYRRGAEDDFRIKALSVTSAIPEPATWLMMIMGFGLVGVASRRRKSVLA